MKVFIVEDNDILRNNIKKFLEIKWCSADTHSTYEGATYKIMTENYDIVILDLWLWSTEGSGIDICKEVRSKWNTTPILMLTARSLVPQKIEGLESGADDYMTKPFDYEEFYTRLKVMIRRDHSLKGEEMNIWNICIKLNEMKVTQEWNEVPLSKLEFDLLVYFAQNQWRVLTKEELTEKVWGEIDLFEQSRSLDVYVWYLRKKFWKDIIETIRGIWYSMNS